MRKPLGILCIVCGIILAAVAVIPLLLRVAILFAGLYAINYGLVLLRYPDLWRSVQILFWRRRF